MKPLSVSVRVNIPFDLRADFVDKISSQIGPFSLQKNLTLVISFFPHEMVVLAVLYAVRMNGLWHPSSANINKKIQTFSQFCGHYSKLISFLSNWIVMKMTECGIKCFKFVCMLL